jgi:hypothetical protein
VFIEMIIAIIYHKAIANENINASDRRFRTGLSLFIQSVNRRFPFIAFYAQSAAATD